MISPEVTQLLNMIEAEFQKRGLKSYVLAVHDTPNDPNNGLKPKIDPTTTRPFNEVVIRTSNPNVVRPFVAQKLELEDPSNTVQWGGGR